MGGQGQGGLEGARVLSQQLEVEGDAGALGSGQVASLAVGDLHGPELESAQPLAGGDVEVLEGAAGLLEPGPVQAEAGGERRRVALCRLLLSHPDLLLLDEPTNHLDAESVDWLEQFLSRFSGTVVAITHDRYFLDNAAEWILELDRGEGIPWKGNYSSWLEQKEARLKQEEREQAAHKKTIDAELAAFARNVAHIAAGC